jgi:hypothetical protein
LLLDSADSVDRIVCRHRKRDRVLADCSRRRGSNS